MGENKYKKRLESFLKKRGKGVLRIAVDDVLSDDIIRFEICILKKGTREFLYDPDVWGDGFDLIAYQDTFEVEYGIPLSWGTLNSGQVFYYGAFEVVRDESNNPELFRYKKDNEALVRIDVLDNYRQKIRELYSRLLTSEV